MIKSGMVYCKTIDAFFEDMQTLKHVMRPFVLAKLNGTLGEVTDEHYKEYTIRRTKLELDLNTGIFHSLLVSAIQKAGFDLLKTGGLMSNALMDKKSHVEMINAYDGPIQIPDEVNMIFYKHGRAFLYNQPKIPEGKLLEQAEIIVVIAEKPLDSAQKGRSSPNISVNVSN